MKKMRRSDRQLDRADAEQILNEGMWGVLATADSEGSPLATPLHYCLLDNRIYFHSAKEGHKLENIAVNPQVSFCVTAAMTLRPEHMSTDFRSAMAFGRARMCEGGEKTRALVALASKYAPGRAAEADSIIERQFDNTAIVAIDITHISGKEAVNG
jgi:nitroimidazol reductase NimA-like FMN-containing flavoprotein (pyridoxamine 5'-phosphate oxidase superfamily)